uniref:Major sperm protein n=1 Tax=Anisakis simplex TaxID=6269 RepID=A0A0M3J3I0_ANISI
LIGDSLTKSNFKGETATEAASPIAGAQLKPRTQRGASTPKRITIRSKRTDHESSGMVDMSAAQSIPFCPVHRTDSPDACQMKRFVLPVDCNRKVFDYPVKAWYNNRAVTFPGKLKVYRLPDEDGVDVKLLVDTKAVPDAEPLLFSAHCPNWQPKRVWINGKLCSQ